MEGTVNGRSMDGIVDVPQILTVSFVCKGHIIQYYIYMAHIIQYYIYMAHLLSRTQNLKISKPPKLAEGEEEDENIKPMGDQVLNTPNTPSKMKKTPAGGVEMPCMNPISSPRVAG